MCVYIYIHIYIYLSWILRYHVKLTHYIINNDMTSLLLQEH